jgi:hypothetical protein
MLWLASRVGLYKFDPASGQITSYRHNPADAYSLASNDVKSTGEDKEGHASAFVAHHDAPLVGERARNARARRTGGDERAGVERLSQLTLQPSEPDCPAETWTRWRPRDRRSACAKPSTRNLYPALFAAPVCARPPSPATMRRSSAGAPQRAGASQRKVGMALVPPVDPRLAAIHGDP